MAISAEPSALDPHVLVSFSDMVVATALFEGLTFTDEQTSLPMPAAAERWDVSEDGLVWTFKLREGLRWSDGSTLTAEDFVFSIRRALSKTLSSEYAYVLYPIENASKLNAGELADLSQLGVSALDARTVRFKLAHRVPHFASVLSLSIAFPVQQKAIAAGGTMDDRKNRWADPKTFVGNGPFTLEEWARQQHVRVKKNPHFREQAALEEIVFYPYESAAAQETAFRAGQLHITTEVPLSKLPSYTKEEPEVLRMDLFLETAFLRFNTTRAPMSDLRVRKALSLAIDRESLTRYVTVAGQHPARSLTPPSVGSYEAPKLIDFDPAAARALLGKAGFPGGKDFPRVEMIYYASEFQERVVQAIQAMWKRELGIDVRLSAREHKDWIATERRLDYDISNARWIGDYVDPIAFLELFRRSDGNNATGWADANYDKTLESAQEKLTVAERNILYRDAETQLLTQLPITPLYHGTNTYLIHKSVQGWVPAMLGFHRLQSVRLE